MVSSSKTTRAEYACPRASERLQNRASELCVEEYDDVVAVIS